MDLGVIVPKEDRLLLLTKKNLIGEKIALRNTPVSFFDVTEILQTLVTKVKKFIYDFNF